jgi:nickel/cobalt transporter (NicO) family protein
MSHALSVLLITAASVALFHTLFGPDHYLPFVVMSRAGKWSQFKTIWITIICGIGHVGSSVVLGLVGIAFGVAVMHLQWVESFRGNLAGWGLIAFGLMYGSWGVVKAIRNTPHHHLHPHSNGTMHMHEHTHEDEHLHIHEPQKQSMTPLLLFAIFAFGPCEPLIPILMYPAAKGNYWDVAAVTVVFGAVTLVTMLTVVLGSSYGLSFLPMGKLDRYTHALAGFAILMCGVAIQFFGL